MPSLRVLTLNILNKVDRWPERLPLLQHEFRAIRPDIAGLQEVYFPLDQERLIADPHSEAYVVHRTAADLPERGNSLLLATDLAALARRAVDVDRLDLGHGRSALRVRGELFGRRAQIAVTHLHHLPPDESVREGQVADLVRWLGGPDVDLTIVTGDFNAEPDEIAAVRMVEAGYRSAFFEANAQHPGVTFPSGLQAPDREAYIGWPAGCLDYVWIAGNVRAYAARLCFDRPASHDPTLYASDHVGVLAELQIG